MTQHKKVVLITGGSRGIGRETALLAASQGWSVALTYRSGKDMAEEVCEEIKKGGQDALALQGDVGSEADIVRNFEDTLKHFGRLDAVVVNAGILGPAQPLVEMSADRLKQVLDINVLGAMLCAREAARHLPRAKSEPSASIVFLSSAAARLGSPNEFVDYAASKGAIDTLTTGLALELAKQNIRVNSVRPGVIETEIHASGGQPDRVDRLGPKLPLGRAGSAYEVATAIVWLCSEEASYVSGAFLDVAGGR